ncbi:hypothetical protein GGS23DRAFT_581054 [Durotheca rogersii]|uniref:uncharacterized protein n=1 Tax=Durotheca rogersii TaxID=419775 RepID=UPI00221F4918|nr:uncharacterized protein GGS23DRAFT_581054 [Durotheca rogersii]KAI5860350.1 hypothetical protein GGS23DRAFT_581054 [Durotheca rogersii]
MFSEPSSSHLCRTQLVRHRKFSPVVRHPVRMYIVHRRRRRRLGPGAREAELCAVSFSPSRSLLEGGRGAGTHVGAPPTAHTYTYFLCYLTLPTPRKRPRRLRPCSARGVRAATRYPCAVRGAALVSCPYSPGSCWRHVYCRRVGKRPGACGRGLSFLIEVKPG